MPCLARYITRRSKGVIYKDEEIPSDSIHIGRATSNQINLQDPRVSLNHALIQHRGNDYFIEAIADSYIRVNAALTRSSKIRINDLISIGPYDVTVIDAPDGFDLAVTIEHVRPLGDDLNNLLSHTKRGLDDTHLNKRIWSWLFFITVLVVFLGTPLAYIYNIFPVSEAPASSNTRPQGSDMVLDLAKNAALFGLKSWDSGGITQAHRFFGHECKTCHQQPFVRVPDSACTECHKTIPHHADPVEFPYEEFTATRCASCHLEHNGAKPPVRMDQDFCADCHKNLTTRSSETTLKNVSDFGADHPEFRPTLVQYHPDGDRHVRISLDEEPPPKETSGLVFTHSKHMNPEGIDTPEGKEVLTCDRCHVPDPGGKHMQPIMMQNQCKSCHILSFDPDNKQRVVPHGNIEDVLNTIEEYYSRIALDGGYENPEAPALIRRRPGTPLTREQRIEARDWVESITLATTIDLVEKRVCKDCHEPVRNFNNGKPGWDFKPVRLVQHWLPKGDFNHDKHTTMECEDCHEAKTSEHSEDILLPGIAVCRDCHGGQKQDQLLVSNCLMCHEFHISDISMHATPAADETVSPAPAVDNPGMSQAVKNMKTQQ